MTLFEGETDGRPAAKEHVVGIRDDADPVAIVTKGLAKRRVLELSVNNGRLVVWRKPGTASGLDAANVGGGHDIGATGVSETVVDRRPLTLEPAGEGFRDRESASTWNVLGVATGGPLAGEALTPVDHVDTVWFAWTAHLPHTRLVQPETLGRLPNSDRRAMCRV